MIAGVILVLAIGGVIPLLFRWLGSGAAGDRAHNGATRSVDALETRRREALSVIKNGDFEGAFGFFRTLPAGRWEANDCLKLAEALIAKDRLVLGWAALEAARRIDPKHPESARALETLQGKLAQTKGREHGTLEDAANRGELLRKVPDGPALGMLVLGLARFTSDAVAEDEWLDRLSNHHNSFLRDVDTTAGAVKLTARLLLETGRAAEASLLLDPISGGALTDSTNASSGSIDREAAWLLSRAALQADQHDRADAMLALAGDFGTSRADRPEPSPFVGSKRCGDCHPRIYHEQQVASRHAQTLRFGNDLKDVPLPAAPVPDPVIAGISHRFRRTGEDRIEVESQVDNRVVRAIVEYAVGSGRHGMTMLAKGEDGVDRELRVSYFGRDQGWGLTKGIDFAPRDPGDHIGLGLGRKTLNHCLSCHTTWFRAIGPDRSSTRPPEGHDRGIGCERCHGPGLNHGKAAETGFPELAIAIGSKTGSEVKLNSCVECHAADGSIQPSDPEFTRAQGTTFLFSRCYTAKKDRFDCTTCHNPHRPVDTVALHYEQKCLGCHRGTTDPKAVSVTPESALPTKSEGRACPINAKANCISCHMPKVEDPTRRSRFTDHHIRVHRDLAALMERF